MMVEQVAEGFGQTAQSGSEEEVDAVDAGCDASGSQCYQITIFTADSLPDRTPR